MAEPRRNPWRRNPWRRDLAGAVWSLLLEVTVVAGLAAVALGVAALMLWLV